MWQVKKNICSIPCTRIAQVLYKNLLTLIQIIIISSEDYPHHGSRLSLLFGKGNRQEVSQMIHRSARPNPRSLNSLAGSPQPKEVSSNASLSAKQRH
jgi:hypothetical protein